MIGAIILLGLGSVEIIVIIVAILLLFGADKMPEIFRTFSKGMQEVRRATDDIKREFDESVGDIQNDLLEVTEEVSEEEGEIRDEHVDSSSEEESPINEKIDDKDRTNR